MKTLFERMAEAARAPKDRCPKCGSDDVEYARLYDTSEWQLRPMGRRPICHGCKHEGAIGEQWNGDQR